MLERDDHFKHLNENPTYIRPLVNSVTRLQEMKAFMRMSSGLDLPQRRK